MVPNTANNFDENKSHVSEISQQLYEYYYFGNCHNMYVELFNHWVKSYVEYKLCLKIILNIHLFLGYIFIERRREHR